MTGLLLQAIAREQRVRLAKPGNGAASLFRIKQESFQRGKTALPTKELSGDDYRRKGRGRSLSLVIIPPAAVGPEVLGWIFADYVFQVAIQLCKDVS